LLLLLHWRLLLLLCWLAGTVAVLHATAGACQLCWRVLGRTRALYALKRFRLRF
jgi:hypothetical protein